MTQIGVEEWLAELQRLGAGQEQGSDALTSSEIVEATGWAVGRVRKQIARAIKEGVLEPTRKYVPAMDGRKMPVPAYRLVRKAVKKAK